MFPHLLPETVIHDLPEDQYYVLSTISSYLSPNNDQPVFRSMTWTLFYPLLLTTPQHQQSDNRFYQILQEVRMAIDTLLNTTNIVGFRENAQQIN
ncbi:7109_t:CDS:2 [Funneliformis geosporum]|uniref:7109_t:CDS:1 n=1 Tax=Funneliformis geosporum TaxID=1117311 RepID=A0A9W4WWG7_9GLOM|nr:7109_t:CDS:2 [Funneliformis geosporum]